MYDLLTRFRDPAMLESLANAIAVDYFRRLNPIEKPTARELVTRLRPDVARKIAATYPQHWND